MLTKLTSLWQLLSRDARRAVADAAGVAVLFEGALSTAGPLLPALHAPAADVAAVSGVTSLLAGFVSWTVRKHLVAKPAASVAPSVAANKPAKA